MVIHCLQKKNRTRYTYKTVRINVESMSNQCRINVDGVSSQCRIPTRPFCFSRQLRYCSCCACQPVSTFLLHQLLEMPMISQSSGWRRNIFVSDTYRQKNRYCICNHLGSNEGVCTYLSHEYCCLRIYFKQLSRNLSSDPT